MGATNELQEFDKLWNYADPAATEEKFRELLSDAESSPGSELHLQLLTQIARTHGLRGQVEESNALLDVVERALSDATPIARVRYLLERGRSRNSSKQPDKGRDLFLEAWDLAREAGAEFHVMDAAHMLAIVEPPEQQVEWFEKAMEFAEQAKSLPARNWLGALYNNLGWTYHEQGKLEDALATHRKGWEFRVERDRRHEAHDENWKGPSPETLIAKWSVARMLRSLERHEEALAMQYELIDEWMGIGSEEKGFCSEEIAEILTALGRADESGPHWQSAYDKLRDVQWLRTGEPERLERIRKLAEAEE